MDFKTELLVCAFPFSFFDDPIPRSGRTHKMRASPQVDRLLAIGAAPITRLPFGLATSLCFRILEDEDPGDFSLYR